ncbi:MULTISPECIES: copper chaperone PCu(A)C [Campylobacter]|uniref:copper chaperone PCu(A)C n=1 Tax=Campylobacter TaxID=194 RepID=UPI002362096F|nr:MULTISPECIES: copper chaperone PCu(A)C [Campylobacter]MCI7247004.1 copper chaperone PCu(A)C [Campylobacter sp.]MDD0855874.1 copper chaperone PCu(A)C [Campylobacter magnus]MDD7704326.1 copper chaperone PCu(A)C [Campylobacteraceae bacterium]MDY2635565.1 copper chaperone PCu(A)C [Campylobacter sp.]
MKKFVLSIASIAAVFGADVEIDGAYARASIPNVPNSAAFFVIKNNSDKDIAITSANSDIAEKNELHTHIKENQMLKMMKIEKLVVPAKSSLELKSGGDHVMLIGLKKELKAGDEISLELSFSDGDKKSIKVPVKDLASTMHKMQH